MNRDLELKQNMQPFLAAFRKMLAQRIGAKQNPLILIQGGFGKHNTGDDTLLRVARNEALKVYPGARVVALCHIPQLLQESYGIEGVAFKSAAFFKMIRKCDALIVAAGGLVNNIDYKSKLKSLINMRGKFVFISMRMCIKRHVPVVLFGVGMHDIPDFIVKHLMDTTIPKVDLISVRDEHTTKLLDRMGVQGYFAHHDPALLYRREETWDRERAKSYCGVTKDKYIVINYRMVKDEIVTQRTIDALAGYLKWVQDTYPDTDVVMMPFSLHPTFELESDTAAAAALLTHARQKYGVEGIKVIDRYLRADEVKNIAQHAELLLLARHHAPVLTYECGVPTIILSYNVKCREFGVLGGYEYIIDYTDMTCEALADDTQKALARGNQGPSLHAQPAEEKTNE